MCAICNLFLFVRCVAQCGKVFNATLWLALCQFHHFFVIIELNFVTFFLVIVAIAGVLYG